MSAPRSLALLASRLFQTASVLMLTSIGVNCSGPEPVKPTNHDGLFLQAKGTAVDAAGFGSGTFYPLAIGNAWTYDGGGTIRYLQNGVPGEPEFEYAFTETRSLIGTTAHEGKSYFVVEQVHHEVPEDSGPYTWWIRIRQDASGLYFLDTLVSAPPDLESGMVATSLAGDRSRALRIDTTPIARPGRAGIALNRLADRIEFLRGLVRGFGRGGSTQPGEGELLELVYPVRVGESWSIRSDFPWPAKVEGVESLDTPAGRKTAYRIGINPFGTTVQEGEWIRVWYSREGFLGYSLHTSAEVTNDNGEPTGDTYVADDSMMVTSIAISR